MVKFMKVNGEMVKEMGKEQTHGRMETSMKVIGRMTKYKGKEYIIIADGDRYEGDFKDGKFEGKGIYILC